MVARLARLEWGRIARHVRLGARGDALLAPRSGEGHASARCAMGAACTRRAPDAGARSASPLRAEPDMAGWARGPRNLRRQPGTRSISNAWAQSSVG